MLVAWTEHRDQAAPGWCVGARGLHGGQRWGQVVGSCGSPSLCPPPRPRDCGVRGWRFCFPSLRDALQALGPACRCGAVGTLCAPFGLICRRPRFTSATRCSLLFSFKGSPWSRAGLGVFAICCYNLGLFAHLGRVVVRAGWGGGPAHPREAVSNTVYPAQEETRLPLPRSLPPNSPEARLVLPELALTSHPGPWHESCVCSTRSLRALSLTCVCPHRQHTRVLRCVEQGVAHSWP